MRIGTTVYISKSNTIECRLRQLDEAIEPINSINFHLYGVRAVIRWTQQNSRLVIIIKSRQSIFDSCSGDLHRLNEHEHAVLFDRKKEKCRYLPSTGSRISSSDVSPICELLSLFFFSSFLLSFFLTSSFVSLLQNRN